MHSWVSHTLTIWNKIKIRKGHEVPPAVYKEIVTKINKAIYFEKHYSIVIMNTILGLDFLQLNVDSVDN